jgi:hypothetical protein
MSSLEAMIKALFVIVLILISADIKFVPNHAVIINGFVILNLIIGLYHKIKTADTMVFGVNKLEELL